MYRYRIYIPFARDTVLLNKCINSIYPQMNEHSSYEGKKIVVMNNSGKPLDGLLEHPEEVDIWELPFELMHAQQMNWMFKDSLKEGYPFTLTTHTDSELMPGAIKAMLDEYEVVKGTKWYAFGIGGPIFVAFNPQFFVEENIWYDAFLFPFYYMDNHMGRLAKLRGWSDHCVNIGAYPDPAVPLVKHVSSHFLKSDPIFAKKNSIAFSAHGQIYKAIWGGLPGAETINDPYASGTLPRKEQI